MAFFSWKGFFSALAVSISSPACAAYMKYASAQSFDLLAMTKNTSFPVINFVLSALASSSAPRRTLIVRLRHLLLAALLSVLIENRNSIRGFFSALAVSISRLACAAYIIYTQNYTLIILLILEPEN